MKMKTCEVFASPRNTFSIFFSILAVATLGLSLTGCSSGMPRQVAPGNSLVTVLLTSSANNQLTQLNLQFTSFTLTTQSGNMLTLFNTPQTAEFIHLNGTSEPLLTVAIPQDTYTSATATIENAGFTCVGLDAAGGIESSTFAGSGSPTTTVTLASPITVTGPAMGLLLNLEEGQSVTTSNCNLPSATNTFTPTFTLTPVSIAATPTDFQNGKSTGLQGRILSTVAASNVFDVMAADGPNWIVQSNASTVYQAPANFSELMAGTPIDMDVVLQPDGRLLATRVKVVDLTGNIQPVNPLTTWNGPLLFVSTSESVISAIGAEQEGVLQSGGSSFFSFGNTTFEISDQLGNLQSLPFVASFDGTNMVAGQNIYISSQATTILAAPIYITATTITLVPQTIDGTVTAVGNVGNFTIYTVTLPTYDLFPQMAVQAGQTTVLTSPNTVIVYVDAKTQMLNGQPIAIGGVFRFNGLVFNDAGTLRMDCGQVNDGPAL